MFPDNDVIYKNMKLTWLGMISSICDIGIPPSCILLWVVTTSVATRKHSSKSFLVLTDSGES